MRWLGYTPLPERPFRPQPVTFPFDPPPFYGSVVTYKGKRQHHPQPYKDRRLQCQSRFPDEGAIAACPMTS